MADYADVRTKPERYKRLKADPYYNALQIKYAYAVTCHKAQGGQWAHVYVDQGYMTDEMLTPDYIHWLYTAFRALRRNSSSSIGLRRRRKSSGCNHSFLYTSKNTTFSVANPTFCASKEQKK